MARNLCISLAWLTGISILMTALGAPARADSSSPFLAAFYDRQMAIVDAAAYAWGGREQPKRLALDAIQVGVGRDTHYVLTTNGELRGFEDDPARSKVLMADIQRFAAGDDGAMAITTGDVLWWIIYKTRENL